MSFRMNNSSLEWVTFLLIPHNSLTCRPEFS